MGRCLFVLLIESSNDRSKGTKRFGFCKVGGMDWAEKGEFGDKVFKFFMEMLCFF